MMRIVGVETITAAAATAARLTQAARWLMQRKIKVRIQVFIIIRTLCLSLLINFAGGGGGRRTCALASNRYGHRHYTCSCGSCNTRSNSSLEGRLLLTQSYR